jgi:proteic killer suppression protein
MYPLGWWSVPQLSRHKCRQHSIRINDQWRICFIWAERGPERLEIVDYH